MDYLARSSDLFVHVSFWTVLHSLWQGAIFAGALAAWRWFTDERDYAARSAAATLTLAFLAAAPIATASYLATSYVPPPEAAVEAPFEAAMVEWGPAFVDLDNAPITSNAAAPSPLLDSEWLVERLPQAIALLWALGVTCGCVRLIASAARLQVVRWQATVADDALAARCRELARRCGLAHPPRLLRSAGARGPYAFGLFRPCIVVPAAWALETTPEALEAAIAHELAHLKRRDLWVLALQRLVETALFYHPGVWYVSRTLNVERERAADRLAAEVLGDPARYAESLYRLASLAAPGSPALTLPFHGETRMKLLERVRHVLRTEEAKSGGIASVGWLCLAPALLAAIFLGQAAFAGSLRADEGEREDEVVTAGAEDEGPEGREEEEEQTPHPDDDEGEERNEEAEEGDDRDDDGREEEEDEDEEEGDDDDDDRDEARSEEREDEDEEGEQGRGDRRAEDYSPEQVRRRFAELNAQIDDVMRERAEALEQKYKAHMQAAQQELARAMQQLQAEAKQRKQELEQQVAKVMAQRQAEAQQRSQAERPREENREGEEGDDADDLTPRERRMLGVIRSLEARLQELEGRGPRTERRDREEDRDEGDRPRSQEREEGDGEEGNLKESPEQERQEREAERREAEQREDDREEPEMKDSADVPADTVIPDEDDVHQFAERLYDALRGGMSEEKKPEFLRSAIGEAIGFELNDDQIRIVLDRARGDLQGFQQIVGRIAAAKE